MPTASASRPGCRPTTTARRTCDVERSCVLDGAAGRSPAGIYAAYNNVVRVDAAGDRIGQFAADIRAAAAAQPDLPIRIDLRNNPGGDNHTFGDVRRAIEAMAHERPGRVSIIAGRSTFSAAGNFITDIMVGPERAGIRLVGEAPGGGLNIYGDVDVVTLPASKIVVLISGDYHERAPATIAWRCRRTSRSR